jgi:NADH:ubiquinone reductase (H+-translocating)
MSTPPSRDPHVVIVGAGFAGLWTARALRSAPVRVTLIDRNNYHTFYPLLYQVAAAELGASDIAYPVRAILRGASNVEFRMAEATGLDPEARLLATSAGPIEYDGLVLALGSVPAFFGVEGAEEHAFPLRLMDDALPLRREILARFEAAAHERSAEALDELLTFVIVGAGRPGWSSPARWPSSYTARSGVTFPPCPWTARVSSWSRVSTAC